MSLSGGQLSGAILLRKEQKMIFMQQIPKRLQNF